MNKKILLLPVMVTTFALGACERPAEERRFDTPSPTPTPGDTGTAAPGATGPSGTMSTGSPGTDAPANP